MSRTRWAAVGLSALLVGTAAVGLAPREVPPSGTTSPFLVGTLTSLPDRAATEARGGVAVGMVELSWSEYEPQEDRFDQAFADLTRSCIRALVDSGRKVTLGLGLHDAPSWAYALPDSRYVDQTGRPLG